MRTIVIGLGNPILTDDGVGVKVAYQLERAISEKKLESVTITEASVGGLRLMETMIGYNRAILIDVYINKNGNVPGTIHRMKLDDLRKISPTQHSASAHDTSFITALDMGNRMGLPLPKEISIFAIEVENVMDFNDRSTPSVAEAIPVVVDAVLKEINIDI
jgi:hydrogenase maturation protease